MLPRAEERNETVARNESSASSRRGFLKQASLGAGVGLGALLTGCEDSGSGPAGGGRRLRAAFSNGGVFHPWCNTGLEAAKLWGKLLNVEVVYFDGEDSSDKQRDKIDLMVGGDWDFFCCQALQTGALAEPVKQLAKRGIPVISMDTLLVEKDLQREAGVWTHVSADQVEMGMASTRYMMKRIGGKGKVIHIGGSDHHSGARGREEGFEKVRALYPNVEVVGGDTRWCDWQPEKARNNFEAMLQQAAEPIAGAFFHNDNMALASIPALEGTIHKDMVVTSVDGQEIGLAAVEDGRIAATAVNPASAVHMMALAIGRYIVINGEKIDDVPDEFPLPTPLVSKEAGNLARIRYLADPKHALV